MSKEKLGIYNEEQTTFERIVMHFAKVRQVKDNHLELATFPKSFFRFYHCWIDGEMTFSKVALGRFIYFLTNAALFGAVAHIIRYAMIYDEFYISTVSTDFSLVIAFPLGYQLFQTFYDQQKEWQALLAEMGNFEVYEKPRGIEENDAKTTVILKLTMLLIFLPALPLCVYFVVANCPDPEDYNCGVCFPFYFPGCMERLRPLCAFIQLTATYSLAYIVYLCSGLYSQVSEYIVIYLQYFQELLRKIPMIDNWDERWVYLNKTLKYHQRILELYDWYYRLIKNVFLVHVFGTPLILAVLVYTFLTDFNIQNLTHCFLWIFALSFVCYFGQRMVNESEQVSLVAYQSIPFDGDNKTAKAMVLLIQRTQKTLHTPAGSLTFCGKDLFVTVMKTMYSYLAVMQSTSQVNQH